MNTKKQCIRCDTTFYNKTRQSLCHDCLIDMHTYTGICVICRKSLCSHKKPCNVSDCFMTGLCHCCPTSF